MRPEQMISAPSVNAASARARRRPVASSNRRRGPQSGQAFGWAWNLRSFGSWCSAFAPRTHGEILHRGIATVVRQALDD
jgi:hypothetical protein